MKNYMNNVETFKTYLTSAFRPSYLRDYINGLSDDELEWLYQQMKEPLEFLVDESYLFYKFKWIKDRNFSDLSKEIYIEYILNPENFKFQIIKPEWEDILEKRYYTNTHFF